METPAFNTRWNPRKLRGFSIQKRLPLLISLLLLAVMISFSLVSYLNVRKSSLNVGRERLVTLSGQLSTMLSQSAQSLIRQTRTAAIHPAIIQSAGSNGRLFSDDALDVLTRLKEDSTTMLVEIRDTARRTLMHWGKDSVQYRVDFRAMSIIWPSAPNDSAWVGRIRQIGDSLYFPVIVAINDDNTRVGYVIHWHLLKTDPNTIKQLSQLLGSDSRFYIGNADRSLWTDMRDRAQVAAVVDSASPGKVLQYMAITGEPTMGISMPVANSSWVVLLEFPRKAVLSTAHQFLRELIMIGSVILVIGLLLAWQMSRNLTRPLNRLTRAAPEIAAGNYVAPEGIDRRDEVGKLARALNALAMQVATAKRELELKIKETEEMNGQLRELTAHLQNIREEERMHIAREMHDELGQLLTGFKMDTVWLEKKIDAGTDDLGMLREKLTSMETGVDEAVKFVRKLAAELRPSLLDDLGIVPALEWYSMEFEKRFSIKVDFKSSLEDVELTPEQATGIFRMYQESLTNVARHARASTVIATLAVRDQRLSLSIVDNGKGFEMNKGKLKTLGLLGMKERAFTIGGQIDISSTPGKGTRVYITLPLPGWESQN